MATVGSLGDVVFSVSSERAYTFQSAKWSGSARYVEHQRHGDTPLLEFTGADADSFAMEITLSAYLGVNPVTEIAKLRRDMERGKTLPLYIGGKKQGASRWVIKSLSVAMQTFGGGGELLVAKVSVSLKAYGSR